MTTPSRRVRKQSKYKGGNTDGTAFVLVPESSPPSVSSKSSMGSGFLWFVTLFSLLLAGVSLAVGVLYKKPAPVPPPPVLPSEQAEEEVVMTSPLHVAVRGEELSIRIENDEDSSEEEEEEDDSSDEEEKVEAELRELLRQNRVMVQEDLRRLREEVALSHQHPSIQRVSIHDEVWSQDAGKYAMQTKKSPSRSEPVPAAAAAPSSVSSCRSAAPPAPARVRPPLLAPVPAPAPAPACPSYCLPPKPVLPPAVAQPILPPPAAVPIARPARRRRALAPAPAPAACIPLVPVKTVEPPRRISLAPSLPPAVALPPVPRPIAPPPIAPPAPRVRAPAPAPASNMVCTPASTFAALQARAQGNAVMTAAAAPVAVARPPAFAPMTTVKAPATLTTAPVGLVRAPAPAPAPAVRMGVPTMVQPAPVAMVASTPPVAKVATGTPPTVVSNTVTMTAPTQPQPQPSAPGVVTPDFTTGVFDSVRYLQFYPDLKVLNWTAEQGRKHYAEYGIREGRTAFLVGFAEGGKWNEEGYWTANKDVQRTATMRADAHYLSTGWREDRKIALVGPKTANTNAGASAGVQPLNTTMSPGIKVLTGGSILAIM